MLIALVSILIFARIVSPRISLLAAGNTTVSLFVYKYSLLLLLIIAELSGRHSHPLSCMGGEDQSLGTKDILSIGPVDTH